MRILEESQVLELRAVFTVELVMRDGMISLSQGLGRGCRKKAEWASPELLAYTIPCWV